MTTTEAVKMIERLKNKINYEDTDSQKKMDALNLSIKALTFMYKLENAWELYDTDVRFLDRLIELLAYWQVENPGAYKPMEGGVKDGIMARGERGAEKETDRDSL